MTETPPLPQEADIIRQHLREMHDKAFEAGKDEGFQEAIQKMTVAASITEADKRDLCRRYSVSPYTDLEGLILEVIARWGKK